MHIQQRQAAARAASGVAGLCMLLAALPAALHGQARGVEASIRGRVLEQVTQVGIAGMTVEFLDAAGRRRQAALTAADGSFEFRNVRVGPFRLRATRTGYVPTVTPHWRIESGEVLSVTVHVDPAVVPLAPLEINARSRSASPVLAGFYSRAERAVTGFFIRRAEIEARAPMLITDLLKTVPGVEIENAPGLGNLRRVRMSRAMLAAGGGSCPVQVFVDGVLATRGGGEISVDELASPGSLEGIEIHRGISSVPPEFLTRDSRCGVIALWTRRGG